MAHDHRPAAVIPKMEKIVSDLAHTCMPAKKTVVKLTMAKMKTGIMMVLANSLNRRELNLPGYLPHFPLVQSARCDELVKSEKMRFAVILANPGSGSGQAGGSFRVFFNDQDERAVKLSNVEQLFLKDLVKDL